MSQHFYKDVKIIKFCKVCGVEFRPQRFSLAAALGLCHTHRHAYQQKHYREVYVPFLATATPEQKAAYRKKRYEVWKKWVNVYKTKRRAQALASYHRNKHKHVSRKHRKVV